jgi:general secretion pathway protein G
LSRSSNSRGFTLIELLVTVVIVAILASIALPLSEVSRQRDKEEELRRALRQLRDAIDGYKRAAEEGRLTRRADESGYPPSLTTLVEGVTDAKSPSGTRIYFLRRVPRDPLNPDVQTPPEHTWGLRSYESPHNNPKAGKDVFDVYSLHAGNGLNGIPYREW